jgi:hypothetical protein
VLLVNSEGGAFLASFTLYGEQAHVPTQCFVESALDAAVKFHELIIIPDAINTGNARILILLRQIKMIPLVFNGLI